MFDNVKEFINLVREDYVAHGSDWTKAGFQSLLVYRFGVWRVTLSDKKVRIPFSIMYRILFVATRNLYGIEIPYSAIIGRRVVFEHQHGIVIHGNSVIGDDCVIRQGVTLGIRNMNDVTQAPRLGNNVNVGAGAKILGDVTIGDDVDIGANAVVLNDVPSNNVAVGIPAKNVTKMFRRVS